MFEFGSFDAPSPDGIVHTLVDAGSVVAAVGRAAESSRDWSGAERQGVLAALEQLDGVLTGARSRWLLAEQAAGTSVRPGDQSFVTGLARRTRSGHGTAARDVRTAEALAVMPAVADAVESGRVPVAHLDALGRAVAGASEEAARVLSSERGQEIVVAMAARSDAPTFGRELAAFVAAHDPDAVQRGHDAQRRRRFLNLSHTPDGTHLRGLLDRMAGDRLQRALEAVGEVPGPDRTPEQERADALDTLATAALTEPTTAPGAVVRPHVSLIMREDTVATLRARYRAEPTASEVPSAPATLDDGTAVPMSEVARILCDCEITRITVDADDLPVNLGRTQRLHTGSQRRAVIARDQVCAFDTCDRPARWCEVHHMDWWDRDGGGTSVERGVLLCTFHHHEVHTHDLVIERLPARPPDVPGGIARARYVVRTRSGRIVAGPGTSDPAPPRSDGMESRVDVGEGPPGRAASAPAPDGAGMADALFDAA